MSRTDRIIKHYDNYIEKNNHNRVLVTKNDFISKLSKVMENGEMCELLEEYGERYEDLETIMLYMKVSEILQKEYKKLYKEKMPVNILENMLHDIMKNSKTRRDLVEAYMLYKKSNNSKTFLETILDKYHLRISEELHLSYD